MHLNGFDFLSKLWITTTAKQITIYLLCINNFYVGTTIYIRLHLTRRSTQYTRFILHKTNIKIQVTCWEWVERWVEGGYKVKGALECTLYGLYNNNEVFYSPSKSTNKKVCKWLLCMTKNVCDPVQSKSINLNYVQNTFGKGIHA